MTKTIFLADIHAPMTEEPKRMYEAAEKNVIILKGDMIDSSPMINHEILKQIPVRVLTFEDVLGMYYCPHDLTPLKRK